MRKFVLLLVALIGASAYFLASPKAQPIVFPHGKRFAFSIVDDTDMTTLERIRPIYAMLEQYGLRTTKTVWVYESSEPQHPPNRGESLANPEYRQFVLELQKKGFEIALHGVRGGSSSREDTDRGLRDFKTIIGGYPRLHVNHSLNKENLYWGRHLFAFAPVRSVAAMGLRHDFEGHDPQSQYFWGDIAKERIKYVRRYTFDDINLLNVNPSFPYRLKDKPYVNYWFPTANGDRVVEFDELLKPENVERLSREGGVCLVYAHLGSGSFNKNGTVDPRFERRIRELVKHDGWFVPASDILDYLTQQPSWTGALSFREQLRLDLKYVTGHFLRSR
jgi:hypothetical protein